ncbi:MAG: response regulator [Proteobacteria bacterium]|nr:response regulator [Pseudomonadota bacterium]
MASILIVEDSKVMATEEAYHLWNAGHSVEIAHSGEEALAKLGKNVPDLILLDYQLPDMDGLELFRTIRDRNPDMPVIMITGQGSEKLAARIFKEGARDYLVKSDHLLKDLIHSVEQVLREERIRRELMSKDEALRLAHASLEMRVGERTSELAAINAQLRREIAERERTEDLLKKELAVNEAMARLAHDLMTPKLDVGAIAQTVLEKAKALTDSAAGFVAVFEPEQGRGKPRDEGYCCHRCHIFKGLRETEFQDGPEGGCAESLKKRLKGRTAFFSNDPGEEGGGLPAGDGQDAPPGKILVVPIMIGEEWAGKIVLADPGRDYMDRDLAAVQRLAELYSLALHRHRTTVKNAMLEAQLQQAQKMEAIGTLAGGIAHDFNNILSAITGYAQLMRMEFKGEERASHKLDQILRASDRAGDLVRQILTFTRRTELHPQVVNIAPVVKEALKLLRATLPTTIEIQPHIDPDPGAVLVDPTQIHQVLMNLCGNAAHAMRDAGGTLVVRLEETELDPDEAERIPELPAGRYQRLSVSDTGHGMDRETMNRIFEPFFTTKPQGEGTGMGLAVVHGIIQGHGGAIQVNSRPGQGTYFNVFLPLVQGRLPEVQPVDSAPLPRGREHVLLVDDESSLVDVGRQMLERLGYTVTGRTSSREALELFAADPDRFDLIITDQTMPGMTGVELAREIMRLRPETPVMICTGYSASISAREAEAMGIRRLLMKPLVVRKIAESIREVLDSAGPA